MAEWSAGWPTVIIMLFSLAGAFAWAELGKRKKESKIARKQESKKQECKKQESRKARKQVNK